MASLGHKTGILDLTQGELGTRGSAAERATEAEAAARILGVSWRLLSTFPTAGLKTPGESTEGSRA